MNERKGCEERNSQAGERKGKAAERPEWARGLRRLYDSVVEEPLPDSFEDLLSKLDKHN